MSDTKALNNLRDTVRFDLNRAKERISAVTKESDQHQRTAATAAALAQQRGTQLAGIEDVLTRRLATALERSANDPGRADHAAAVREARGALETVWAVRGKIPADQAAGRPKTPKQANSKPRPPNPSRADLNHGKATTYSNHKCRCEPCKAAWCEQVKQQKARRYAQRVEVNRRLVHPQAPHGTENGYRNYGCQCQPCRNAGSEGSAKRRKVTDHA